LGIGFMLFGSLIAAANIAYHVYKMQSILTNIGPILLLAIFLMVIGVQFIALGFMSEIMVSSYYSIEGKKPYSVREFLK